MLYRLYAALGGNRHRISATLTVFAVSGFALHDLPISIIRGYLSLSTTAAFLLFGCFSLVSASFQGTLKQRAWPRLSNAALNIGLVVLGLGLGALLNRSLIV